MAETGTLNARNIVEHDSRTYRHAPIRATLTDLVRGLGRVELWGTLGWLDIQQRYRRSVIGPFWVTLSLAAFVLGLGVTYGTLFRMTMADYLPYLSIGFVIWNLLSGFVLEGCAAFIGADAVIKQVPAPLSVHVYRLLWRAFIIFLHNAVIIALVLAFFRINPGWGGLLAIPGFIIVMLNGLGFAFLFGTLSARFRDIPPLMTNVMQTLFFITPVIWHTNSLRGSLLIADWNPFYHLIEIVRSPLLGVAVESRSWLLASAFTILNVGLALAFYARFRWRIPYWI